MTWQIHLMPMTGTGSSRLDPRVPKYMAELVGEWQSLDYGSQDVCLVAMDGTEAEHQVLTDHADVMTVPADLNANLTSGQVTAAQAALETLRIPAGWINTTFTWREVVRIVCGMFVLNGRVWVLQAVRGVLGRSSILNGRPLTTQVNQLPSGLRTDITTAAGDLGLDLSGITLTTTLRTALHTLGVQFLSRPYVFAPNFTV